MDGAGGRPRVLCRAGPAGSAAEGIQGRNAVTESTRFVIEVLLFAGVGTALGLGALLLGALLRPKNPGGLKSEIYECGEPTIGPAWVQFDLRFYVVALVFVVFDVEIALLYPWAVVY